MIFAHVSKYFGDHGTTAILFESVLEVAMNHVNATSGMQLSFNYPFMAHKTIEPNDKWIDVDDGGVSVLENRNIIVCISDDELELDESDDPGQLVNIHRNKCTAIRFVSTKKIHLHESSSDISNELAARLVFCSCFFGTHFCPIDANNNDSAKCPLCCKIVDSKYLNGHFNECDRFCA